MERSMIEVKSLKIKVKNLGYHRVVVILFVMLLVILSASIFWYWYYTTGIEKKYSDSTDVKKFVVTTGESSETISQNLKKEGLIRSSVLFDIYAWRSGFDYKLQAGEYEVPKNLSIKEIVQLLSLSREIPQNKITIIEGWKNTEIAEYLEKEGIVKSSEFFTVVSLKDDWWDDYEFLKEKPKNVDLEGYLFPDTYLIYKNASSKEIIQKMLDNFAKKITQQMLDETSALEMSLHEIVTLASIIEKEVSSNEDRELVSGIFHSRLKLGIGLQADSTVNYITGKNISRSSLDDISLDNPYNTYKYKGLPPGPINNPGLSAIRAAIYPKSSEYLYFLTTPDGRVIYSKTFDEHVLAKRKYLR